MKTFNNLYNKHFIALTVLFVLGNACITTPQKNADRFNFLAFMISCVIAVLVYLIACFIPINRITVIPVWLLGFYCISDAFITFVKFISYDLLPQTQRFLIILPIALLLIYIGLQKSDVLYKFSLLCGVLSVAVILFFFISTAKDFNVKNIFIYKLPRMDALYRQVLPYLKSIALPAILLSFFAREENIKKSTALCGLAFGFLAFGICLLNSVLLFGIEFSGVLDYPYSSAGSTVTFGNLFTRMDGFLYFVYLATCVAKCAVGIFVIKKSRNKLVP